MGHTGLEASLLFAALAWGTACSPNSQAADEAHGSLASANMAATPEAANKPGAGDEATPAARTYTVGDLNATISNFTYEGTLCPSRSTTFSTSSGAFSAVIASQLDGTKGDTSATCTMTVELAAPRGLRFGDPFLCPTVFLGAEDDKGGATVDVKYTYSSGPSQSFSYAFQADNALKACQQLRDIWSPACGDADSPSRVQLTIELSATVQPDSVLSLFTVDAGFGYIDGVSWQSCADGAPVRPPLSELGEGCGGRADQRCQDSLTCDRFDHGYDDSDLQGVCVDPHETLPPQPEHGPCGGARNIACEAPFQCAYSSEQRAGQGLLGTCETATGKKGEHCGGAPNVACQADFICSALHTCVPAVGAAGDDCGLAGLPECGPRLECNNNVAHRVCEPRLGIWGEPCGSPDAAACGPKLVCGETTKVCEAEHPGELYARCDATHLCNPELICSASLHYCSKPPRPLGSPCVFANDCASQNCGQQTVTPDPWDRNKPAPSTETDTPAATSDMVGTGAGAGDSSEASTNDAPTSTETSSPGEVDAGLEAEANGDQPSDRVCLPPAR